MKQKTVEPTGENRFLAALDDTERFYQAEYSKQEVFRRRRNLSRGYRDQKKLLNKLLEKDPDRYLNNTWNGREYPTLGYKSVHTHNLAELFEWAGTEGLINTWLDWSGNLSVDQKQHYEGRIALVAHELMKLGIRTGNMESALRGARIYGKIRMVSPSVKGRLLQAYNAAAKSVICAREEGIYDSCDADKIKKWTSEVRSFLSG